MQTGPVYLISDAHLGVASAESERDLVAFIRSLPGTAGGLIINGDLFDFWFEWRHVVPHAGLRVLGALGSARDAGLPVLYIAGNHDCWGGRVLREQLGLEYHVGPWRGQLAGWDVEVEHGDGLREREDAPYRRLRAVLRHPWAVALFRWLHPDIGAWMAHKSSHTSRNYQPQDEGEGLRRVAAARLTGDDAPQLVVYGHSHVAALEAQGRGVFGNPGAWLDGPTALRLTPESVARCRWDGTAMVVEGELPYPVRGASATPASSETR